MKKTWENAELEIIGFEAEDIFTTSDPMSNGGSNDAGGYKSGPDGLGGFGGLE